MLFVGVYFFRYNSGAVVLDAQTVWVVGGFNKDHVGKTDCPVCFFVFFCKIKQTNKKKTHTKKEKNTTRYKAINVAFARIGAF